MRISIMAEGRMGLEISSWFHLLPLPHKQMPQMLNTHIENNGMSSHVVSLWPSVLLVLSEGLLSLAQQHILCALAQGMRVNSGQQGYL